MEDLGAVLVLPFPADRLNVVFSHRCSFSSPDLLNPRCLCGQVWRYLWQENGRLRT